MAKVLGLNKVAREIVELFYYGYTTQELIQHCDASNNVVRHNSPNSFVFYQSAKSTIKNVYNFFYSDNPVCLDRKRIKFEEFLHREYNGS